jgi:hypothetical protein
MTFIECYSVLYCFGMYLNLYWYMHRWGDRRAEWMANPKWSWMLCVSLGVFMALLWPLCFLANPLDETQAQAPKP